MQVRFEACGGHFAMSLDGVGEGFKESKKPHTLEFKTMNEKSFKATKSMGVKQSKPSLLGAVPTWYAFGWS
jgi:hypothetical protein